MTLSEGPGLAAGTRLHPVGEAARLTDWLREFIDRAVKRGKIPLHRVDGVRTVRLEDVLAEKARRAAR